MLKRQMFGRAGFALLRKRDLMSSSVIKEITTTASLADRHHAFKFSSMPEPVPQKPGVGTKCGHHGGTPLGQ
jgi:hypothetical protein